MHIIKKSQVQAVFLAPTEILARQHFASVSAFCFPLGIKTDLLVGSLTAKQKEEAKARLKTGETDLIIGTHALLEDNVEYKTLGFAVIDEQHRFGVEQRKVLEAYFSPLREGVDFLEGSFRFPHILHMTATPIPRTLALTLAGDQDISIIREYPK